MMIRITGIVLVCLVATLALWFLALRLEDGGERRIVGGFETIRLLTAAGDFEATAKIDTGADSSSIDADFARRIGLEVKYSRRKAILTSQGLQRRPTAPVTFLLAGESRKSLFTVTERGGLSARVLIGKRDLEGLVVDPGREFLTTPGSPAKRWPITATLRNLAARPENKGLLIFPMLGSLVVVLRLVGGITTYGIFAPTIIAFTLLELGIWPGTLLYLLLVSLGIGVNFSLLRKFKLPHVAEIALLIFFLVAALVGISVLEQDFLPPVSDVFFPVVITSHLIERATKTAEDHRMLDALALLFRTLIVAILLAMAGTFLLTMHAATLWFCFMASILAAVAAGKYTGLRLSEPLRFRLLRRGK